MSSSVSTFPSQFLSASDLIKARKASSSKSSPRTKLKPSSNESKYAQLPKNAEEQSRRDDELRALYEQHFESISAERVRPRKELGEAVWLADRKLAKVIKRRGKHHYFGLSQDGVHYLYPEEVMFLLEAGDYEIMCDQLPLSMQQAYHILFDEQVDIDHYRVFSLLIRSGYHVKKIRRELNSDHQHEDAEVNVKSMKSIDSTESEMETDVSVQHRVIPLTMDMIRHRENVSAPLAEYMSSATNWKEYKEMENQTSQLFSGLVLDTEDMNYPRLELLGPTRHLYSNEMKPVINPTLPTTAQELYSALQDRGPKSSSVRSTSSKLNITFEVYFTHSKKPTYLKPDLFVVVEDRVENVEPLDLVHLNQLAMESSAGLVFAVVDSGNVCFYQLTPFAIWSELPELWKQLEL
ncbi:tRNA-splicing endonuclease subunit Sen54 [Halotydeus destructor]|nr:tRNA-splicing endonuclease subunit Sen54 [Halotydeus destructor]